MQASIHYAIGVKNDSGRPIEVTAADQRGSPTRTRIPAGGIGIVCVTVQPVGAVLYIRAGDPTVFIYRVTTNDDQKDGRYQVTYNGKESNMTR
jgi:hypothetical protein